MSCAACFLVYITLVVLALTRTTDAFTLYVNFTQPPIPYDLATGMEPLLTPVGSSINPDCIAFQWTSSDQAEQVYLFKGRDEFLNCNLTEAVQVTDPYDPFATTVSYCFINQNGIALYFGAVAGLPSRCTTFGLKIQVIVRVALQAPVYELCGSSFMMMVTTNECGSFTTSLAEMRVYDSQGILKLPDAVLSPNAAGPNAVPERLTKPNSELFSDTSFGIKQYTQILYIFNRYTCFAAFTLVTPAQNLCDNPKEYKMYVSQDDLFYSLMYASSGNALPTTFGPISLSSPMASTMYCNVQNATLRVTDTAAWTGVAPCNSVSFGEVSLIDFLGTTNVPSAITNPNGLANTNYLLSNVNDGTTNEFVDFNFTANSKQSSLVFDFGTVALPCLSRISLKNTFGVGPSQPCRIPKSYTLRLTGNSGIARTVMSSTNAGIEGSIIVTTFTSGAALPTVRPTSRSPTSPTTRQPTTKVPTPRPTTRRPTQFPSTLRPTTRAPTMPISRSPSVSPSRRPTIFPTQIPTFLPSASPSARPTLQALSHSDLFNVVLLAGQTINTTVSVTNTDAVPIIVNLTSCDEPVLSSQIVTILDVSTVAIAVGMSRNFSVRLTAWTGASNVDPVMNASVLSGCAAIRATVSGITKPQIYYASIEIKSYVACSGGSTSRSGTNYPSACTYCDVGTYVVNASACVVCPESKPYTRTAGSLSSAACEKCTLGHYCPIGNILRVPCPFGAYEPNLPSSFAFDRLASDCVRNVCLPKYWCGSGAAEGTTYVQHIEYEDLASTVIVKQRKQLQWRFRNIGNRTIYVEPHPSAPAYFVMKDSVNPSGPFTNPYEVLPHSSAVISVVVDAEFIDSNINSVNETIPFFWYSNNAEKLTARISVQLTVVTLIVVPEKLDYVIRTPISVNSLLIELIPLPVISVFNTLCNNSVSFRVRETCQGNLLPSWLLLRDVGTFDPFAATVIEAERGLPVNVPFRFNYSDSVFNFYLATSTAPVPILTTCLEFEIILIGMDLTLVRTSTLSLQIKHPCAAGSFSGDGTDGLGCIPCPIGFYQPGSRETFCTQCPDYFPRTLLQGRTGLVDCVADSGGFQASNTSKVDCPAGANCTEVGLTLTTLPLLAGFWRAYSQSLKILRCPKEAYCAGGRFVRKNTTASSRRLLSTFELSPDGMCRVNHTGAFCYGCLPGTVKRGDLKICEPCTDNDYDYDRARIAGIFSACVVALCLIGVFVFSVAFRSYQLRQGSKRSLLEANMLRWSLVFDIAVPLQIVTGYLQVIGGMSVAFRDVLPPFFEEIRRVFNVLAADFIEVLDFGCTLSDQNHFSSLLISTTLPVGVAVALGIVHVVLMRRYGKQDALLAEDIRITSFSCFLILLFLVYPSVSTKVFATFNCRNFDDGSAVIFSDPATSCLTEKYKQHFAYAVVMLFVYPFGIPAFYGYFLYKEREMLNPFTKPVFYRVAAVVRSKNSEIRYLKFLWRPYRPQYFWFELFELFRKLAQTSIVVFIAPGTSGQMIFQLGVTVFCVVVLNALAPYAKFNDNFLAIFAQWVIFGVVLITLLIRLNRLGLTGDTVYNQTLLDAILIILFFSVFAVAIIQVLYTTLIHRGGITEIFFCFDWEGRCKGRCRRKVVREVDHDDDVLPALPPGVEYRKSVRNLNAKHKKAPRQSVVMLGKLSCEKPIDPKDVDGLLTKLRQQIILVQRDMDELLEQEKAKCEIIEDEYKELERNNLEIVEELENTAILLDISTKDSLAAFKEINSLKAQIAHLEDLVPDGIPRPRASFYATRKSDLVMSMIPHSTTSRIASMFSWTKKTPVAADGRASVQVGLGTSTSFKRPVSTRGAMVALDAQPKFSLIAESEIRGARSGNSGVLSLNRGKSVTKRSADSGGGSGVIKGTGGSGVLKSSGGNSSGVLGGGEDRQPSFRAQSTDSPTSATRSKSFRMVRSKSKESMEASVDGPVVNRADRVKSVKIEQSTSVRVRNVEMSDGSFESTMFNLGEPVKGPAQKKEEV